MTSTLMVAAANWTDILAYGLIDYLYENVLEGPMNGMGRIGRYVGNGVQFAIKTAASVTHPLAQIGSLIKMG